MKPIILLLAAALCCGSANALVPHQINYQGYLTNPGGVPVNTSVTMALSLYNVGTGGAALYTETQTVTVTNGVFNVSIGSVSPLPLPFDVPYWLGVTVGADAEMTPRQPVAASGYAIRSAAAESLAPTATVPAGSLTGALGTAQIADHAVTQTKLSPLTGAAAGKVLGTDGTNLVWQASGGGGTVTAVTATAPLASTGGNTPNITLGSISLAGDVTGTQGATTVSRINGMALSGLSTGLLKNTTGTGVPSIAVAGTDYVAPSGNISGSAASFTGALTGDVTGTQAATTIAAPTVTGKSLTGFVSGAGTVSTSDTILTAINKLNGNVALKAPLASPQFTGTVGIGTAGSGSPLTVAGMIESTGIGTGGIKFPDGTIQTTATNAVVEFGSFFGMTAGPGNTGANDYPATIAISAAGPSVAAGSAVNFPRMSASVVGGITINNPGVAQTNNTEFILPAVGTYRVTWHISVDQPAQWSLWISTAPFPAPGGLFNELTTAFGTPARVGQAVSSAQLVGDVVFRNSVANSAIQIRNYASPVAVSVTPLPGGTQAQAVSLIIQRLQ